MTPLKLTLSAFGPFATSQTVDFTQLGQHPLFLINGETGAGKTSLLDAMCVALYGDTTSGSERKAQGMRCDYADSQTDTEVEFEFLIDATKYRIYRFPRQFRHKKRGEGFVESSASARLERFEADGTVTLLVSSKVTEVDKHIERIIGLTSAQFRQVMVLPQGKFRQFILANSNEREAIFSQLFDTTIFKRIEEKLAERSKAIKEKSKRFHDFIATMLQSVGVESQEALGDELNNITAPLSTASLEKNEAQTQFQKSNTALDKAIDLQQRFALLRTTQSKYDAHLTQQVTIKHEQKRLSDAQQAAHIAPLHQQFQQWLGQQAEKQNAVRTQQETMTRCKTLFKEAQRLFEQANVDAQTLPELGKQVHEFERQIEIVTQLDSKRAEQTSAQTQVDNATLKLNTAREAVESTKTQITTLEAKISEQETALVDMVKVSLQQEADKIRLLQCQQLAQFQQRHGELSEALAQATAHHQQQMKALEHAQVAYNKLALQWHSSQAVILAQQLNINEPCMVCGSTEHPQPAQATDEAKVPSQDDLDAAQTQIEQARTACDAAQQALLQAQLALAECQRSIKKEQAALGVNATMTVAQAQYELDNTTDQLNHLNALQSQNKRDKHRLHETRALLTTHEHAVLMLSEALQNQQSQLTASSTALSELQQQLPKDLPTQAQLTHTLAATHNKIRQINDALSLAQSQLDNSRTDYDKALATLEALNKALEGIRSKSEQTTKDWHDALERSVFDDEPAFIAASLTQAQMETIKQTIDTFNTELIGLEAQLNQLNTELQEKVEPDAVVLKEAVAAAKAVLDEKDAAWLALSKRQTQLQNTQEKIAAETHNNKSLEAQYSLVASLSEVATGKHESKISLQRFVLAALLDDVLVTASLRLQKMTKSRYKLVRHSEPQAGSKDKVKGGLEIFVEDTYNSTRRAVNSLSGGESFMAALSLALGLSDVVQSHSGGTKLDTLFIDEGFGSLDVNSLDEAIQILIELQMAGRTVGIISHVEELKSQLSRRIDVKKGKVGSYIELVS